MIPILYTTFNRLNFTKQTLPILLENSPEGKVYIYDNGSTDGTPEYLNGLDHDGIACINLLSINRGISAIMNEFFELTKDDEVVAKVDNDTLIPPNWLGDLDFAMRLANLTIVQAKHYFWIPGVKDWNDLIQKSIVQKTDHGNIIAAECVGGSGILIKRQSVNKINAELNIWGWSHFQLEHPEYRYAFFDGVTIELLDMEFYNRHKTGGEKYRKNIGRPEFG